MQIELNVSNVVSFLMVGGLSILAILHFMFYFFSNRRPSHLVSLVADLCLIWLLFFTGHFSVMGDRMQELMGTGVYRPVSFWFLTVYIVAIQYLHITIAKLRHQNARFMLLTSGGYVLLGVLFIFLPSDYFHLLRVLFFAYNFLVQLLVYRQLIMSLRRGDRNSIYLLVTFTAFVVFLVFAGINDVQSRPNSWADYAGLFILMLALDLNVVVRSGFFVPSLNTNSRQWKNDFSRQIEELQNSNQTKDRFLSIIAHDLKNPIASVKMISDIYLQEARESQTDHQMDLAQSLSFSIDNICKLLDNLLTWSRTQNKTIKCEPKMLDINEMVDAVKFAVDSVCDSKSVALRVSVKGESTIYADPNMLQTILRNMITNAVKFSYPDNFVDLTFHSDSSEYLIKVEDYGVGMTKDIIDDLFQIDKIQSHYGTNREQGTGLGLILCNEFVRKHGGRIEVSSEEGLGSTFLIHLPREN